LADGSVVDWGPPAQDPDAVAVDADNNVYIGDGSGKVHKVTPEGGSSIFSTAFLGNVCSLTVDRLGHYGEAGTVLVGNARALADVVMIEPDQTASVFQSTGNLHIPFGLLVHPNGHVFIAEFSGEISNISGLYQVDSGGLLEMVHEFQSPFALAYRYSTDEIFISDVQDSTIYAIDTLGDVRVFAAGILARGLAFDQEDNLYVADRTELPHRILKISGNGYLPTAVDDSDVLSARSNSVAYSYPNPFNPSTTVVFTVQSEGLARVAIYNPRGKFVAELVNESLGTGRHEVIWNGRDKRGQESPSGVYFIRLEAGGESSQGRMVLIR